MRTCLDGLLSTVLPLPAHQGFLECGDHEWMGPQHRCAFGLARSDHYRIPYRKVAVFDPVQFPETSPRIDRSWCQKISCRMCNLHAASGGRISTAAMDVLLFLTCLGSSAKRNVVPGCGGVSSRNTAHALALLLRRSQRSPRIQSNHRFWVKHRSLWGSSRLPCKAPTLNRLTAVSREMYGRT